MCHSKPLARWVISITGCVIVVGGVGRETDTIALHTKFVLRDFFFLKRCVTGNCI